MPGKLKKAIDKQVAILYNNICVTIRMLQFYIGRDAVQIKEKYSRG